MVLSYYTHIKRSPNSRCVFLSVLEDTTKMTAYSRATGLPDLAGDLHMHNSMVIMTMRALFLFLYFYMLVWLYVITREIRQASSPTMRGHFDCILKANGDYTTGVWWAFYMRVMDT